MFHGVCFGAPVASRRRPGREHLPDRLPGGLHRPLVRRPGRGHDLSAHRQPRPVRGRRPVRATLAAGPRGEPRDRRGARPGAPDRAPAALRGRARHRGPGHARAGAPPARDRLPAGHHHGARRDRRRTTPSTGREPLPRWEDQDFVGQVSVAAPYEAGDRGPLVAVVDYGLKANIVRSLRRRGARVRVLPHTATAADVLRPDVAGVVLSPGPGRPGRLDGPTALARADHRRRPAAAGHLPRPPDRGPRRRRRDAPAALRASRRQPPGARTWAPAGCRSPPRTTR